MEGKLIWQAGLMLLIGAFLWVVTIVLHPVGGSIEYLRSIRGLIMGTHIIAILSLPFCAYGFYGTMHYCGRSLMSRLGFVFSLFALVAAMGAAGINGLALPLFIDGLHEYGNEDISLIMQYSIALNHMFDYIFMGGLIISVACWSISMVKNKQKYKWIGYVGLVISTLIVGMFVSGFYFLDLPGLRAFVLIFILWIVAVGILMIRR